MSVTGPAPGKSDVDKRPTGEQVVGCALAFEQDELPGFEKATLPLQAEDDGELCATLVRTKHEDDDTRPAVLYVHGYVDYFFQTHVAEAFEKAGFRFYALDLRRSGRSLREGNREHLVASIDEYFEELDEATQFIQAEHGELASLVAHSTGGLVCALYLASAEASAAPRSLVVTSPFLQFNLGSWNLFQSKVVASLSRLSPHTIVPQRMKPAYGKTIHKSEKGEWDYDLAKKPLRGFPLYAGWFRMIHQAHEKVRAGLRLTLPVLSLHSVQSRVGRMEPVSADLEADLVLNVNHMKELSPRLGDDVTLVEVKGGVHDLTLSKQGAREFAIEKMVDFVKRHSRHD
jgi:alpha-beta hydrolase superfamily lysophospholipase